MNSPTASTGSSHSIASKPRPSSPERTMSLTDVSTDTSTRKGRTLRRPNDTGPRSESQPTTVAVGQSLGVRSIDRLKLQIVRLGDSLVGHVALADVQALLQCGILLD